MFEKLISPLAGRYPSLVVLQAAASAGLNESFHGRLFFPAGTSSGWISEAAGMACVGKMALVVVDRMDAAARLWDEIRYVAAHVKKNITIMALPPAATGPAPWISEDLALMRLVPNCEVFAPADLEETGQMLEYGVSRHLLSYIRAPGSPGQLGIQPVFGAGAHFSPGVWPRLREGNNLTLISCGNMTAQALMAAKTLAASGVHAAVLHAGSIKPIDREALGLAAKKTRKIVTCEEQHSCDGLGGAVAAALSELGSAAKLVRVGLPDRLMPVSVGAADILRAARHLI